MPVYTYSVQRADVQLSDMDKAAREMLSRFLETHKVVQITFNQSRSVEDRHEPGCEPDFIAGPWATVFKVYLAER